MLLFTIGNILTSNGKYVLHYENLQLYLRLGLKPKKIHCILGINQSQWLKSFFEFDKQKRTEAEIMENVVYDKTMENLRNRIDVKLVSNKKGYLK